MQEKELVQQRAALIRALEYKIAYVVVAAGATVGKTQIYLYFGDACINTMVEFMALKIDSTNSDLSKLLSYVWQDDSVSFGEYSELRKKSDEAVLSNAHMTMLTAFQIKADELVRAYQTLVRDIAKGTTFDTQTQTVREDIAQALEFQVAYVVVACEMFRRKMLELD